MHYGQPSLAEAAVHHLECVTSRPRSILPIITQVHLHVKGSPSGGTLTSPIQMFLSCPAQENPCQVPTLPSRAPALGTWRRGLTKAAEGCLIGTETHPADYGLARGMSTLKRVTRVQGSPSVQCLKIGPGLKTVTSGNNIVPLNDNPGRASGHQQGTLGLQEPGG